MRFFALLCSLCVTNFLFAQKDTTDLFEISFDELMKIKVEIGSKKKEDIQK